MDFYEKESVSLYLDDLEVLEDFVSERQQHIQLFSHPSYGIIKHNDINLYRLSAVTKVERERRKHVSHSSCTKWC